MQVSRSGSRKRGMKGVVEVVTAVVVGMMIAT